jgi:hypothetical protein
MSPSNRLKSRETEDGDTSRHLQRSANEIGGRLQRLAASPTARLVLFVSAIAVAAWLVRDQLRQIRWPALLAARRATPASAIVLVAPLLLTVAAGAATHAVKLVSRVAGRRAS